jgi:glycosyltransferase involved in cell wall biosynthesis
MPRISVIIPTRNESENIGRLLKELRYLEQSYDYEAVVVDDSSDNTAEVARENGAKVIIGKRKGLANAVIDGIRGTESPFIIVMDADLQHPPSLVSKVIDNLNKHDLVVVTKHTKSASADMSSYRKLQSNLAVMFTQSLVPVPVSDPMAGFFGIRRKCIENIPFGNYLKFDYSQIPPEVQKPVNWDLMDDIEKMQWCVLNDFTIPMTGIEGIGFKIGLELFAKAKWVTHAEIPMQFQKREVGISKGTMHSLQKHVWRLFLNSLDYDIELPKGSEEYYLFYEGDDWNRQWKRDIARLLYEITHEYKPNKTLDAGCGSSPNIRYLYGVDRTGMDINKDALEFIKQYSIAKFVYGSVLDIPFDDNTFDMVVCCEVVEHFYEKDVKKALSELVRVLEPHGHLILATPNYGSFWWNTLETMQKITQRNRWTSDHHTQFTRQSLKTLCTGYGLKEIRYDSVMGNMDMLVTFEKES